MGLRLGYLGCIQARHLYEIKRRLRGQNTYLLPCNIITCVIKPRLAEFKLNHGDEHEHGRIGSEHSLQLYFSSNSCSSEAVTCDQ
jgi:hypothetical protein